MSQQDTIEINAAYCFECKDVIESKHRHDFRSCSCGNVMVDGGREYLRRCYKSSNWRDVSTRQEFDELRKGFGR